MDTGERGQRRAEGRERSARKEVADFWDAALQAWIDGHRTVDSPLLEWMESYRGVGAGVVDLDHYPDPYIGDLRGLRREPRLVFLGLNPGIGYDTLQGPAGTWTQRIADLGYSKCFERSPAEDPKSWMALHHKKSVYWRNILAFTGRWLGDPSATVSDVLNFELYPGTRRRSLAR